MEQSITYQKFFLKTTRHDRFIAAGSRSHMLIIDLWERLPAAIEMNPFDVGYFMNS